MRKTDETTRGSTRRRDMRTTRRRGSAIATVVLLCLLGSTAALAQSESPAAERDLTFIVGYTQPPVTLNPFKHDPDLGVRDQQPPVPAAVQLRPGHPPGCPRRPGDGAALGRERRHLRRRAHLHDQDPGRIEVERRGTHHRQRRRLHVQHDPRPGVHGLLELPAVHRFDRGDRRHDARLDDDRAHLGAVRPAVDLHRARARLEPVRDEGRDPPGRGQRRRRSWPDRSR